MNIINELRELKRCTDNHHLVEDGIILHNGYVQINDTYIKIFINELSKKINITNTEVLSGTSDDKNVFLVCKANNMRAKNCYILMFNTVDDTVTSYAIPTINNLHECAIIVKNNILYFLSSSKDLLTINLNSTNNLITTNISKYPPGKRVLADVISKTYLGDFEFCDYMMLYDDNIYIPIKNTKRVTRYNIKTGFVEQKTFEQEDSFSNIIGVVQCGEKNDYAEEGAVATIVCENKIVLLDFIDFSCHTAESFNSTISSYAVGSNELYICSDNLYTLDLKTFECTYTYISDKTISQLTMLYINNNFFFENLSESYTLENVEDACYVTVSCLDDSGDPLDTYNDMLKKNGKVKINAKNIEGYKVMQYSSYEANTDDDFVDINFFYQRVDDLLTLDIVHSCDESILSTMSLQGRTGDAYNISPININGYIHDYSVNNVGIFSHDMDSCNIYYKSSNDFATNSPNKTYICVNCICEGKLIVKKYISSIKGDNIELNVPSIPCYTPVQQSITIKQVNYDIYNVNIDYIKEHENIKVKFYYLNKLIYEDIAKVVGNIATVTAPEFLTITKSEYDVENMTELKITCNPKDSLTLMNLIDDGLSKTLHTICESGNTDVLNNPVIEKYKYKTKNTSTLPKMKVVNVYYEQYVFDITFHHILNNNIIKEEKIQAVNNATVNAGVITEYSDGTSTYKIETSSCTSHKVDGADKTIKILYEKKKIKIIAEIFNENNVLLDTQIFVFEYDQPRVVNVKINRSDVVYKDTEINTDIDVTTLNKEKLTYIVGNIKPTVNVSYSNGNIVFNTSTCCNKFITRVKKNSSYLKSSETNIYITKDLNKNNSSTKTFLDNLNIKYKEINTEQIKNIEDYSIVIDGDIDSKVCFLDGLDSPKIQYIPLNVDYLNLEKTITYATYNSLNLKTTEFNTMVVNDDFYISSLKYNKNNKRLYCSFTHVPNDSNYELFEIETIDIRECKIVHSSNINVNTIHNFDKAVYVFNNNQNVEPDYNTLTDKNNVSYYNKDSEYIIDTILHCYLIDTLGNRTKLIHEPIVFNIIAENTENSFTKNYYTHSLDRYNHRYKGPRESYKYINMYDGIHLTCKEITEQLTNINNSCKYDNNILIEVDK